MSAKAAGWFDPHEGLRSVPTIGSEISDDGPENLAESLSVAGRFPRLVCPSRDVPVQPREFCVWYFPVNVRLMTPVLLRPCLGSFQGLRLGELGFW